jgi:protoporphyrinogen oxidase
MPNEAENHAEILIVGGGITGLAAAYISAQCGKTVRLIEASDHCGGLLRTFPVGDTQLEHFYHHFFTHDAEIHWLLNELGLENEVVYKESTMGVFAEGTIYPFNSIRDLFQFKPIQFLDKLKFGLSSLFLAKWADWGKYERVSSSEWLKKWSGKTTFKNLWEPMLRIKFGPYKDEIPVSWMIGRMRQRLNSRKAGKEQLGYLNGSLQVLCDKLVERLKELGVEILTNSHLTEICIEKNRIECVKSHDNAFTFDQVLFTVPGPVLSTVWPESNLKSALGTVQYFGVYCGILELKKPLGDVYWLNVAEEDYSFGGIIEHTNFIDPETYGGRHVVYLSRYFAYEEEIAAWRENKVRDIMLKDLSRIYPNFSTEDVLEFHLFRANNAAPLVDRGYSEKVVPHKLTVDKGFVANMTHLYPDERGVNNSIRLAAVALAEMGLQVDFVPSQNSLVGAIKFGSKTEKSKATL